MDARAVAERAVQDVIRQCRGGADLASTVSTVLRSLRRVMPIDAAFFATADPETLMFTGFSTEDPLGDVAAEMLDNELGGGDVNRFTALALSPSHVSSLDAATADDRMASPRYRDIMRPLGLGDELRAALVSGSACWGYLCLHREDATNGFTIAEIATIGRLAPHIATAVRQATLLYPPDLGPAPRAGVVVLDDALDVVASTPEADELLSLVADPGRLSVPPVVFAVAAALKDAERRGAVPPVARARARTGHWLEVHASRLRGSDDRIAVVLEPAEQQSVIRILLSAYGLTGREQDVAACVLRGESTKEICAALHISAHTVQDHMKKIFDKTGVRSRRDLMAQLLGG